MSSIEEMMERVRKLRNGETVSCKKCENGVMKPIGDYKTTPCFVCDKCGNKLNIN